MLTCLRMVPAVEAVSAPFFEQFLDEDGAFVPNDVPAGSVVAMLDEVARLTVLRPTSAPSGTARQ